MTQPENSQLQALEDAIMKRAEELAQEFHDKANRQRDIILRDAAEHLQTAEERELMAIKDEAERHFHRVTQAGELKMQSRLDQLRWELVQTVQTRLTEHMKTFCNDLKAYRAWLTKMVRDAAAVLPDGDLVAEVNADDLLWLDEEWPDLVAEAAPQRTILLADEPVRGLGGINVRTVDNRAQVDNRFEGRLSRFAADVQRVILHELFPADISASARSGGPQ
ncbi:MAG: V-type ATP synthase subunit E family protein [Gammaproteobacteria bacterium]|jgi:V/A-type H+-transporting ATPase subunit E